VPEEPSNGELGRLIAGLQTRLDSRFSELNSRLDKMVSVDVYTIQTTHIDQRLALLQSDLQQVRTERDQLEVSFAQYQREEARRREEERQKRLYQAIVPILTCLLATIVAVWAVVTR